MADKSRRRFRIGYALSPKKVESVIQPSLIDAAKERGVDLLPIDISKPLSHQGPFHCILHKLYDPHWTHQLSTISSAVIIIDPPSAIQRIHNRITMLEPLRRLRIPPHLPQSCSIPNQHLLLLDYSDSATMLTFPVIAKPLVANGSFNSHQMSLVLNKDGLTALLQDRRDQQPILLQEFVNHGGVVFKVYVAGEHVQCVKRKSLPDYDEDSAWGLPSIVSFSQISNLAMEIERVEMPPLDFVEQVGKGLRQALELNLFNFDMIRDSMDENRYLVIDINYFPGYAKLPSYEKFLTDFFCDVAAAQSQSQSQSHQLELIE